MNLIFGVVIVVLLARVCVQLALERLNRAWALLQREKMPENLAGLVTPEAHARSAEYAMEHSALDSKQIAFGAFIKITFLASGLIALFYNSTILQFGQNNFWAIALLTTLVHLVLGVFFWPFDWAATFGIEQKYGFNRQTPWLWFTDNIKDMAISIVLSVPLTALVLWMASGTIRNWWLWAFIVLMIYEVALTFIYPNFIEPLFNKFEPLKEGSLKNRLEALAKRADVPVSRILVMDGSKRSRHANAYFAGFGESRRIVLYDTLLEQLNEEEVEAVLAHEIGHMKHQHILRQIYVGAAWQLVGLFIIDRIIHWESFYNAFGLVGSGGIGGAFFILSFITGAFSFWLIPVMSRWHRGHEYEADAYAARLVGSPAPLISGLRKLTKESLASIEDHPVSHAFYASHPTLKERENAMNKINIQDKPQPVAV